MSGSISRPTPIHEFQHLEEIAAQTGRTRAEVEEAAKRHLAKAYLIRIATSAASDAHILALALRRLYAESWCSTAWKAVVVRVGLFAAKFVVLGLAFADAIVQVQRGH